MEKEIKKKEKEKEKEEGDEEGDGEEKGEISMEMMRIKLPPPLPTARDILSSSSSKSKGSKGVNNKKKKIKIIKNKNNNSNKNKDKNKNQNKNNQNTLSISCYTFGSPPCISKLPSLYPYVTSYILGDDVIAHYSPTSILRLEKKVISLLPKGRYMKSILGDQLSYLQGFVSNFNPLMEEEGNVYICNILYIYICNVYIYTYIYVSYNIVR